jgi:hypothetical protein
VVRKIIKNLKEKNMKRVERKVMIAVMILISFSGFAQKIDEQRMERDIEVAENILSTMLKQQFDKRSFFPIEVKGNYRQGYGVTFTIPNMQSGFWFNGFNGPEDVLIDGHPGSFSYSYSDGPGSYSISNGSSNGVTIIDTRPEDAARVAADQAKKDQKNKSVGITGSTKLTRTKKGTKINRDSLKEESNQKTIKAIKEFLADYGDLIGQLAPTERIVVTNRGEGERMWFGQFHNQINSNLITVEANKGDISQYKQNKLTRDQLMNKLKVVNSEMDNEVQPDLELLASIFNRLYRSDLSKTYFTQDNTYYERLKDYGVIYYMEVYSSNQQNGDFWNLPTVSLEEVDQATRDKKVKELYPLFTKSIKEDMLEYGRTLKSLKDDENLILNIKLTRCIDCGIPSSIELSVKNSVLKDYSSGKLSKEAAMQQIAEKKGAEQ